MEELKIDPTIEYDVVPLPSNGIYYSNRKKTLRVAYLTATDENILSSPNLIQSNTVIDELLRRKILDRDLPIEDIVDEDRQAILIFLRNTAFGYEYVLHLTDPQTELPFDTTIDLSSLKLKEFNLVENANGEYTFFLNKSQVEITFKFLTKKQLLELEKMRESWNGNGVAPIKTKELEMMIKSVGGINDMMQIYDFVQKMPIKDAQEFRKFVNENKPGLELTQTVKTPSGGNVQVEIGLGVEFFRPFYGI